MLDILMLPLTAVLALMIVTADGVYRRRVLPALAAAGRAASVQREPQGYWSQIAAYGELCRERGASLLAWRYLTWVPALSTLLLVGWLVIGLAVPQ
ncbi:MAG: hypothetical protein P8009_00240 [Gammaproteobacteria bacterium]